MSILGVPGSKEELFECQNRLYSLINTALQAGRSQVRFPMLSLGIFHWHNPSGLSMALGSTQCVTKWVPGIGDQGWQPNHLNVSIVMECGRLNVLQSSGPVQSLPYTVTAELVCSTGLTMMCVGTEVLYSHENEKVVLCRHIFFFHWVAVAELIFQRIK